MYVKNSLLLYLAIFIFACQTEETADVVMVNGNFYTVNAEQPKAEAVAVKDGRIMQIGTTAEIEKLKGEDTELIDLKGQFAMPGLIEGHGHFSGLGQSMLNLNFLRSASWDEIVEMVAKAAENAKPGDVYKRQVFMTTFNLIKIEVQLNILCQEKYPFLIGTLIKRIILIGFIDLEI